jgi:hypothetical protein
MLVQTGPVQQPTQATEGVGGLGRNRGPGIAARANGFVGQLDGFIATEAPGAHSKQAEVVPAP